MKPSTSAATLFALSAILYLSACVQEESWSRERQQSVTTTLIDAPPAKVIAAAERAIRELDPRSVQFDYIPGGFRASRSYFVYFVLGAAQGAYQYQVSVDAEGQGSRIETRIYAASSTIAATGLTPTTSSFWQDEDAYRLLLDRIRYHAGTTADWVSCDEAKKLYGTNGAIEPICLGAKASDPQG